MNTRISNIKAENFRSYRKIDINLEDLNLLIGVNASGKSNFIQILRFVHDIYNHGLEQAIGFQGGLEFVKYLNANRDDLVKISFDVSQDKKGVFHNERFPDTFIYTKSLRYRFALKIISKFKYSIIEDVLELNTVVEKRGERKNKKTKSKKTETNLKIILDKKKADVVVKMEKEKEDVEIGIDPNELFPFQLRNLKSKKIFENSLLIEEPFGLFPFRWGEFAELISIYDFDPKLPKKSIPITSGFTLKEDGENMANALKKVLSTKESKRKFFNLLSELIPSINDIKVSSLSDKSVYFTIKEGFFNNQQIPASMISDGTIHSIGLILALYFEQNEIIVIEEPERNIHPKLIGKIAALLKEASQQKQIFITTHNPIFLKNYSLENVIICKRNKMGNSDVNSAKSDDSLRVFLENELGLDDLLIQNLF